MPPKHAQPKLLDEELAPVPQLDVEIDIIIETISNFIEFGYEDYCLELTFQNSELLKDEKTNNNFKVVVPQNIEIQDVVLENFPMKFRLLIQQNDLKDINKLCDCPLLLSLYGIEDVIKEESIANNDESSKTIVKKGKSKKSITPEKNSKKNKKESTLSIETKMTKSFVKSKNLLACGSFDLLQYICDKEIQDKIQIYLYPNNIIKPGKTSTLKFNICSNKSIIMPDLKFSNITILILESIFNIEKNYNEDEIEPKIDAECSFVNGINELDDNLEPICTFRNFNFCKPADIFPFTKWDSLPNILCNGVSTEIPTDDNFHGVYTNAEDLPDIDHHVEIINFNSIHRFLLLEEQCVEIENLINFQDKHILIQIKVDGVKKYVGYVDMSPLLYPNIRYGRFFVPLSNIDPSTEIHPGVVNKPSKKKNKRSTSKISVNEKSKLTFSGNSDETLTSQSNEQSTEKVVQQPFLIFKINLGTPITERCPPHDFINIPNFIMPLIDQNKIEKNIPYDELVKNNIIGFQSEVIEIINSIFENVSPGLDFFTDELVCKKLYCIPGIEDSQSDLADRIIKLIAVKFNVDNPTSTNDEFKALMAKVYNELMPKVENIISDHYANIHDSVDMSDAKRLRDEKFFIEKEFSELNVETGCEIDIESINENSTNPDDLLDKVFVSLKSHDYLTAERTLNKVLKLDSSNYFALLTKTYLLYLKNDLSEFLQNALSLTKISGKACSIWAVMYLYFRNCNYKPGYQYAWMKIEYNKPVTCFPYFWGRKEFFFRNPYNFNAHILNLGFYLFESMGCYKFALSLLKLTKKYFEPLEFTRNLVAINFMLKDYDELEDILNNIQITPENEMLINLFAGHLKFAKNDKESAKAIYEIVYHDPQSREHGHLAFLRCGFMDIKNENYENAKTYFITCCNKSESLLSWFGLGVCYYRLNIYNSAEMCFSKVTTYRWKFAEPWLYLTMINLKNKNIANSLKCFAMAKKNVTAKTKCSRLWDETNEALEEVQIQNKNMNIFNF